MTKYEEKKKLLVAESEVYRELLKLELQTFKVYGRQARRKLTAPATYLPLVMSGVPLLGALFRRKSGSASSKLQRLGAMLLTGWKAYQRFAPMFAGKGTPPPDQTRETAAEEYLSRRL